MFGCSSGGLRAPFFIGVFMSFTFKYDQALSRRDSAISRLEAIIVDWKDREGHIVSPDARKGIAKSISVFEKRLKVLKDERRGFAALIEEFKRLDEALHPSLPFVKPAAGSGGAPRKP